VINSKRINWVITSFKIKYLSQFINNKQAIITLMNLAFFYKCISIKWSENTMKNLKIPITTIIKIMPIKRKTTTKIQTLLIVAHQQITLNQIKINP
jgi:hypothetical protein